MVRYATRCSTVRREFGSTDNSHRGSIIDLVELYASSDPLRHTVADTIAELNVAIVPASDPSSSSTYVNHFIIEDREV